MKWIVIAMLYSPLVYANTFPIRVLRVIDGDTLEIEADLSFGLYFVKSLRVAHVDTPEMHGPKKEAAQKAKVFAREFCLSGPCEIRNPTVDKYGRILSDVWCSGKSLSEALLKAGLGIPYEGGKK